MMCCCIMNDGVIATYLSIYYSGRFDMEFFDIW